MFWIKATDKNIWRQTNSTAHEASGRMDSKEKRGKRNERNLGADLPPEATCPECGKYSELDCFFGHSLLSPRLTMFIHQCYWWIREDNFNDQNETTILGIYRGRVAKLEDKLLGAVLRRTKEITKFRLSLRACSRFSETLRRSTFSRCC